MSYYWLTSCGDSSALLWGGLARITGVLQIADCTLPLVLRAPLWATFCFALQ